MNDTKELLCILGLSVFALIFLPILLAFIALLVVLAIPLSVIAAPFLIYDRIKNPPPKSDPKPYRTVSYSDAGIPWPDGTGYNV